MKKRFWVLIASLFISITIFSCGRVIQNGTTSSQVVQDRSIPKMLSTSPTSEATQVALNSDISVMFSKDMDASSINTRNFMVLGQNGSVVAGSVRYDQAIKTAFFSPAERLMAFTRYSVVVSASVKDTLGLEIGNAIGWSFTTSDILAPQVTTMTPSNGATLIPVSSAISAVFSRAMDAATINPDSFRVLNSSGAAINGTTSYDRAALTATFTPSVPLSPAETYTAILSTTVKDSTGISLPSNRLWSFRTLDLVAPIVLSTSPLDGANGVLRNGTKISVIFNKEMDVSTINASSFLVGYAGKTVPGTVALSSSRRIAEFTPNKYFEYGTTYVVTMAATVKDLSGNLLGIPYSFSFSTNPVTFDIQTVDPPTTLSFGWYANLGLDTNRKNHIAYKVFDGSLRYATDVSGSWVKTEIDRYGGLNNSIFVDRNNKVHISYFNYQNGNKLMYATNASGQWEISTVESVGTPSSWTSIALDPNNKVHITYYVSGAADLKYATNASGQWSTSTIDSAGIVGKSNSIWVDPTGKIHVAYWFDGGQGNQTTKYATKTSGPWEIETIDAPGGGGQLSMKVDSNNKVHIVSSNISNLAGSNTGKVKYISNTTGSWVVSEIAEIGLFPALALDPNGTPHVCYYEGFTNNLIYTSKVSGTWISTSVEQIDVDWHFGATTFGIAVDSLGQVHLAYGYFYGPYEYTKFAISHL